MALNKPQLLQDILIARYDLPALASAHALSVEELAGWADQPQHQHTLRTLCTLADLQTQLVLCRYRLSAAAGLIKLAGHCEPGAAGPVDGDGIRLLETARKACVDLLRLDLPRAVGPSARPAGAPGDADENAAFQALIDRWRTDETDLSSN